MSVPMVEDFINESSESAEARSEIVAPSGLCVYVAPTSADLAGERLRLRRELAQFGHTVLPVEPPGQVFPEPGAVRRDLARCALSVHPVGAEFGPIAGASDRSVVQQQYEVAGLEAARRRGFRRVPWMHPGTHPVDERQEAFIAQLQDDPQLVVATLEAVKTSALEMLEASRVTAIGPRLAFDASRPMSVYLICDGVDVAASVPVEDALFDCGFEVIRPLTDGDERQLREDHQDNLQSADGVLIFHGATSDFWLRTKLRDLHKAFGHGRRRPFAACAVVLADPVTAEKRSLRTAEAIVVDAFGPFESWLLGSFVERLARRGRTG